MDKRPGCVGRGVAVMVGIGVVCVAVLGSGVAWGQVAPRRTLAARSAPSEGRRDARPTKAADVGPTKPLFVERPGIEEFSGKLIVRPKSVAMLLAEGVDAAAAAERVKGARERIAASVVREAPEVNEFLVQLGKGETENEAAARLMATGDYEYVTPDWICHLADVPNDPQYGSQWHHPRIGSPQAWSITTGDPSIIIGVVDTGVDLTHPDLAGARVPGYNSAMQLAEADGGTVADDNGHGTLTSGTAAAIGNNAVGVSGVGWHLRFMMVKATADPGGTADLFSLTGGARWAVEHGARVASVSFSGVENASIRTTGTYIKSIGGLLCWAAGNSATNLVGLSYPDVVVVGATDQSDNRAGFSSYGPLVDCFAPGVDILGPNLGGGYGAASGTSFATPMTAGALGMIWSVNPSFTPDQVQVLLLNNCDDLGAPGVDDTFGHGRINVFRAVTGAVTALTPAPPVAADDAAVAMTGSPILIDALANDTDPNIEPLTIAAAPVRSARGGTVSISPGTGPGGRDQLSYTAAAGVSGTDTFAYTAADPGGLTASATVTVTVYDRATFARPQLAWPATPGLGVSYYALNGPSSLPDFSVLTPYATGTSDQVNYPATAGAFAGSGRADDVGAVFSGYLQVPADDVYTFYTSSDDGSALYIGPPSSRVRVVSNDGLHPMREASGQIGLLAGTYQIRVEFFEHGGDAGLIASVSGLSMTKQTIPSWMLSRAWGCRPDWDTNGVAQPIDVAEFVVAWWSGASHGSVEGDYDGNGRTEPADLAEFVSDWFAAATGGC